MDNIKRFRLIVYKDYQENSFVDSKVTSHVTLKGLILQFPSSKLNKCFLIGPN